MARKSETAYLEDLARRIETAARMPNNKAKLFAIADDIRKYKERKYDGDADLEPEAMLRGEVEIELGANPGELEGIL